MLGLECASFEVTTAFAGFLGPAAVAAHAGLFSITTLCYISLPFALATAATIRVGNLLGAGNGERLLEHSWGRRAGENACQLHQQDSAHVATFLFTLPPPFAPPRPGALAATTSRVVILLGSGFMAACGLAIYLERNVLGGMFTEGDAAVVAAMASIAPLGALYQVWVCARAPALACTHPDGHLRIGITQIRPHTACRSATVSWARARACCALWAASPSSWSSIAWRSGSSRCLWAST